MFKALLFIIIVFFTVRAISQLFLQGSKKKNSNIRFFYQTFKNVRDQQKKQQKNKKRTRDGKVNNDDLDHIEEAEYEDVTEDNSDK